MPQVIVLPHAQLCPEGTVLEVPEGKSLCEALVENDVEIEHACEMSCACTTCHVIIREGFQSLNSSSDDEEDLLDAAWGLESTSRLSCQVKLGKQDITIEIPKYTINHARENH
ncbi:ISC system 2Fe-2S type ferredoxin [Undibacterium oligocarboniphilum]|uniref:2Fe-2S ferredoxin n=1 Tax=Undibacterium oligocarboniphilum TaxID=666702 RepID=A0A850QL88_9BURK|nr:ISC system 2Fe-2S type ferredoxin [Undibacterium oligocarboniphilum]MBC3870172.1 ISC system 2Fe-2S type ferredoxin [Undibacterium oligocarboniphilum]NVO78163.1 ISC system 2Fe-2S type ferredoxin [Undibacterium oligocarboniphilum]